MLGKLKKKITGKEEPKKVEKEKEKPKPSKGSAKEEEKSVKDLNGAGLNGTSGVEDNSPPTPIEHVVLTKADLLKPIPTFQDAGAANKQSLFIHKLRLCQIVFDWSLDDPKDAKPKEVKRQQLLELVEFIGKNKNIFTEQALVEITRMVSANLFRALPPKGQKNNHGESDEEDPFFEPSWPHLQVVYEFFLRFIVSSDVEVKVLKKHITGPFVLRVLDLFDSEDHRERDYLKTILHRIYAKFMSLRAFIRKAMNNVFYMFIWDTEKYNGIAELLEILGSIINGFALPLKEEHKSFLNTVLVPMHKVRSLQSYHQQLSYCVTQFVDKDPKLAVDVIGGLIKFWPVTNSSKEVLYLNELEELLELTQPQEFKIILPSLFRCLSRTMASPHFQVAERVLFYWHNEYISGLIADHRADLLPIIYPVLHTNSQHHWNPTVNNLTLNVLKIFMELDSALVEEVSKKHLASLEERHPLTVARNETWGKIFAATAAAEAARREELARANAEREAQARAERAKFLQQMNQENHEVIDGDKLEKLPGKSDTNGINTNNNSKGEKGEKGDEGPAASPSAAAASTSSSSSANANANGGDS